MKTMQSLDNKGSLSLISWEIVKKSTGFIMFFFCFILSCLTFHKVKIKPENNKKKIRTLLNKSVVVLRSISTIGLVTLAEEVPSRLKLCFDNFSDFGDNRRRSDLGVGVLWTGSGATILASGQILCVSLMPNRTVDRRWIRSSVCSAKNTPSMSKY